jgi:hypothetical protein
VGRMGRIMVRAQQHGGPTQPALLFRSSGVSTGFRIAFGRHVFILRRPVVKRLSRTT